MGLIKISGDYSDLLTVFPLPKTLLKSILPKDVYDGLLPVPANYGLRADEHLVMLHLGRQKTGPPFYRFNAQEAKVEIPFIAPPFSSSREKAVPSVYKHSLWTDSLLLATSARMTMGLRTEKAVFDPPNAPGDAGSLRSLTDGAVEAKYEVKGKVSWFGRKDKWQGELYAQEKETVSTAGIWWFGEYAGGSLCQFPMTAKRENVPYKATIRLHLPSIQLGSSPLPASPALRENYRIEGEWLVLQGVTTWWNDASWELNGPHKAAEVEKQLAK
ncbi:hypothetical protein DACRYDRAFT_90725 [Dacryopinax primogenitus]|uniref:Uncharacterized protein n=1 Tax=Dacryopinax primogenitus (strain DJM 731) TaxID=1858805 RepID=M5G4B0_DACPD|nr:uncharacterized protein DACRYDRAFT_90725 [Dacryopinax primogenitus]EJT98582.1 hypothetical protein DACRYDRAFT_90725 [Dacryopinax primogenitus]